MASLTGILTGIMYSIMNTFNANLSGLYGNALASVLIHLTGALCLWPLLLTQWGRRSGRAPWYLYFGGVLGIVTVIASNVGITAVGVTATMAIALLGQILVSALFDHFGLFGMKRVSMNGAKLLGMLAIALGAGIMIVAFWQKGSGSVLLAILLVLISGLTIVLARVSNAHLAVKAGTGHSAIMNHTTGLAGSLVLLAFAGFSAAAAFPAPGLYWYDYIGGPLGAVSIFALNYITKKITNVQLTLLLFVGQVFSGILIDALFLNKFAWPVLMGAVCVAIGLVINSRGDMKNVEEAA